MAPASTAGSVAANGAKSLRLGMPLTRVELVAVRIEDAVAGQQVAARAPGDPVVAATAHDQVGAVAAVDDVVVRAAVQAVIAVAAVDLQIGEQRALLLVARIDAPFAHHARILEFGIAVHDVVAGTRVDHRVFDVHRLVEGEVLLVDRLAIGQRRESKLGNRRVGQSVHRVLGTELDGGADPDEAHHAIGEFHHHLALCGRAFERGLDGCVDVLREIGDVLVGRVRLHRDLVVGAVDAQGEYRGPVELSVLDRARIGADRFAAGDETLVRRVPLQRSEFVAVQEAVPADRHVVGYDATEPVEVAAEEQHAIIARAAVEAIGQRRDEGVRGALDERQAVGQQLEGVVAVAAEEQVLGLPVVAAGEHIVAGLAEDPVLAGAALQHVVAGAAEDHIAAFEVNAIGERLDLRRRIVDLEREVIDRRHVARRVHFHHVVAGCDAAEIERTVAFAGQVQHHLAEIAPLVDERRGRIVAGAHVSHQLVAGRARNARTRAGSKCLRPGLPDRASARAARSRPLRPARCLRHRATRA